ncbi:MAG TPA: M20/M25/M40 family metallo-hydrolase [Myxococcota bacterium]|nr:M20/M25/M40 family metallo-hydrolase [Myxococcota bacterium]
MRRVNRFGCALALLLCIGSSARVASANDAARWERTARRLLEKAVSVRTAAGYGQVPALAEYLAEQLRGAGFADDEIQMIRFGDTLAMTVRLRGDGSRRPMLLNTHLDVVDADPADWDRDPFTLIEEDGYLFARGVADNKVGVAVLVTTLMRLKSEGFAPTRDVILVLTGDEESSMLSTRGIASRFPDAEFMLNDDDVGGTLGADGRARVYYVQGAEKTYASFRLRATNPGGHSSRPTRENAIYELSRALLRIEAYAFPGEANELTRAYFRETARDIGGELGDAMRRFADDPSDERALAQLASDPEYVGLTRTTCVATLLAAGHAENALPQSATATVNCRIFPGTEIASVRDRLAEVIGDPRIEIEHLDPESSIASDASPLRADVMAALRRAVDANFPGLPIVPKMSAGASDCMWFRAAGIPSYVVSGLYTNPEDDFWHGLNERIPVDAIPRSLRHWHVLISELASRAE